MNGGEAGLEFSLVRGGAVYALLRRWGVIAEPGLGLGRRAALFMGAAVLPLAALAWAAGELPGGAGAEALERQYGVMAKLLVAIPLFVAAEALAERVFPPVGRMLARAGLLPEGEAGGLREAVEAARSARDSWWGTAFVLGAAAVATAVRASDAAGWHETAWAATGRAGAAGLSAAGWWYLLVANPLYLLLGLGWVWRLWVVLVLFRRVARLPLALVPTHPDRAGGLGFLEQAAMSFAPFALALSAAVSGQMAHDILLHGVRLEGVRVQMAVFGVLLAGTVLAPYAVFIPKLARTRRRFMLEYSALTSRHGRLVERRWLRGEAVRDEEGLLGAPELGPLVDVQALYRSAESTRVLPFGKTAVLWLVGAVVAPMVPVILIQVPMQEVLGRVLRSVL